MFSKNTRDNKFNQHVEMFKQSHHQFYSSKEADKKMEFCQKMRIDHGKLKESTYFIAFC